MQLIPVIDLLGGQVVRAIRGQRDRYQPVVSRLCDDADPVALARAMLAFCASRRLYVADLDALGGKPAQRAVLERLGAALPGGELWVDAGFVDGDDAFPLAAALGPALAPAGCRFVPVFGTETLAPPGAGRDPTATPFKAWPRAALSLDHRDGQPLGSRAWWQAGAHWPRRLILMSLERVGTLAGPDLARLAQLTDPARRGARRQRLTLIGAGGIGDDADLAAARRSGAAAWLVASALHDLRLTPSHF